MYIVCAPACSASYVVRRFCRLSKLSVATELSDNAAGIAVIVLDFCFQPVFTIIVLCIKKLLSCALLELA